ncbi:hypothetical protein V6N12_008205 [Hibiscus sabdariffa]|uniref:Uncharacterized protein n=1 Tax=Hibiscus sabdariffa TaxID=183260 RepID=A0ABR2AB79_9ROSI
MEDLAKEGDSPVDSFPCALTLTAYLLHDGSARKWEQRLKPLGVGAFQRGERPTKIGYSWFSAKSISVERMMSMARDFWGAKIQSREENSPDCTLRSLSNHLVEKEKILVYDPTAILVYDPTAIIVYDPTAILVYDPTAILVYDPTAILVYDTTAIFLSINNPNIVFAAYHFTDDSSSWTGALESLSRSSSSWTAVLQEGEVPAAQVLDNFHAQNEHVEAELFSRIRNLENRLIDRLPPQLNRGEYATLVRENIDQSINLFHYQSSLSNEIFEITVLELKADLQDQLFNLLLSEPDHRLIQILSESPFPESAIRREALEFILLKMEAVNLNLDNARSRFDKVLLEQLLRLGLNFTFNPCFGLWFDDPSPWPISGYPPSEIACGQTISSIARRVSFPTQSLYQFQSPRLMFSPYGV